MADFTNPILSPTPLVIEATAPQQTFNGTAAAIEQVAKAVPQINEDYQYSKMQTQLDAIKAEEDSFTPYDPLAKLTPDQVAAMSEYQKKTLRLAAMKEQGGATARKTAELKADVLLRKAINDHPEMSDMFVKQGVSVLGRNALGATARYELEAEELIKKEQEAAYQKSMDELRQYGYSDLEMSRLPEDKRAEYYDSKAKKVAEEKAYDIHNGEILRRSNNLRLTDEQKKLEFTKDIQDNAGALYNKLSKPYQKDIDRLYDLTRSTSTMNNPQARQEMFDIRQRLTLAATEMQQNAIAFLQGDASMGSIGGDLGAILSSIDPKTFGDTIGAFLIKDIQTALALTSDEKLVNQFQASETLKRAYFIEHTPNWTQLSLFAEKAAQLQGILPAELVAKSELMSGFFPTLEALGAVENRPGVTPEIVGTPEETAQYVEQGLIWLNDGSQKDRLKEQGVEISWDLTQAVNQIYHAPLNAGLNGLRNLSNTALYGDGPTATPEQKKQANGRRAATVDNVIRTIASPNFDIALQTYADGGTAWLNETSRFFDTALRNPDDNVVLALKGNSTTSFKAAGIKPESVVWTVVGEKLLPLVDGNLVPLTGPYASRNSDAMHEMIQTMETLSVHEGLPKGVALTDYLAYAAGVLNGD